MSSEKLFKDNLREGPLWTTLSVKAEQTGYIIILKLLTGTGQQSRNSRKRLEGKLALIRQKS